MFSTIMKLKIPLEHWTLNIVQLMSANVAFYTWLSFVSIFECSQYLFKLDDNRELHVLHQVGSSFFHHSFDCDSVECNSICENDASTHCNWTMQFSMHSMIFYDDKAHTFFTNLIWIFLFCVQFVSRYFCMCGVYCYFHISLSLYVYCVCKLRTNHTRTFTFRLQSRFLFKLQADERWNKVTIFKSMNAYCLAICDPNWGTSFEFELEQWTHFWSVFYWLCTSS